MPSIGFYQPVFKEAVRSFLDPGFTALEWLHNPEPELRELALHLHLADARAFERHDLTGLLSPKFYSKTGLSSTRLTRWIGENPGYDLYGINGQPFVLYQAYNTIEQAAGCHGPDFEVKLRNLCAEIGLDLPTDFGRQNNLNALFCNYWCGTREFWTRWNRDVLKPLARVREQGSDLARGLFSATSYASPTSVFLITFIYERLLSLYLASNKTIRYLAYPWKLQEIIDLPYHPRLKEYLIDVGPWVDELDRIGHWTAADRLRLRSLCASRIRPSYTANGFDPLNFDLPSSPDRLLGRIEVEGADLQASRVGATGNQA